MTSATHPAKLVHPAKQQYAALPYRRARDGTLEVMLVTSRKTGRWIVPKGWPAPGKKPCESAAREAIEKAGVIGRISEWPAGRYSHKKRLADGSFVPCAVDVFLLEVQSQLSSWTEQHQRTTNWFNIQEAAKAVREPALSMIIQRLADVVPADSSDR